MLIIDKNCFSISVRGQYYTTYLLSGGKFVNAAAMTLRVIISYFHLRFLEKTWAQDDVNLSDTLH